MTLFRYPLTNPIRILLISAIAYLSLPIIFKSELLNFFNVPVFYFFGCYILLVNFPNLSLILYSKPLYLEDLVLTIDNKKDPLYKTIYEIIMIFILSILFAFFAEYALIRGIKDKPIIEILGIIGGNLSLYIKTQNIVGKILLYYCHELKKVELHRRISSRVNSPIESKSPSRNKSPIIELMKMMEPLDLREEEMKEEKK